MPKLILEKIKTFDQMLARMYVSIFNNEKNSLLTFLFHGLFNNNDEIELNHVNPQQGITSEIFRQFVEYYLQHDYSFVSPQDILDGLDPERKYVLITFDDGYYNNHLALPILRQYQVPAVFFISSNHIVENKCFWWDVIYRERIRDNTPIESILAEIEVQKNKKSLKIEQYISDIFGEEASQPISDIDRPFSPSELKIFSEEELVYIGNHTHNHAILTNYPRSEIKDEIVNAQKSIFELTGIEPDIIAYPNGNFSSDVIQVLNECGIRLGITVSEQKNYLPINALKGDGELALNRFTLWGNQNIEHQCALFRADKQFLRMFKTVVTRRNEDSMPN